MRQALLAGLAILAVVAVVAIVVQGPDDPVGPADDSDGLVAQPHAPQGTAATVAEPSLAAPEGLVEYPDPVAPELAAGPALPEPPTADPAKEQRAPAIPTVPTIAATALADELDTDWADPAGQGVLEARTEGPAALDEPALRDPGPAAGDDAVALSASPGGVDAVGAPLQSAAPSPQQDEGPAANRAPDEPLKAVSAPVVPKPSEPLEVTASPEAVADSRQSDSRDAEAAVLAEVARLNALAAKALDRYRLLLPEEDNAYSYYRRVLALDPANSEAQQGLAQIVQKYGEMAESALGRNDLQKAELYVGRALSVDPGHSETLLLLDRIERAMADAEASRQAAAERAAAEREAARAAQREQGQSEETAEASPPSGLERLMRFVGGRGSDADR